MKLCRIVFRIILSMHKIIILPAYTLCSDMVRVSKSLHTYFMEVNQEMRRWHYQSNRNKTSMPSTHAPI